MKMAKASEADMNMALELTNALEALAGRWGAVMPEKIERLEPDCEIERFDIDDPEHCRRVVEYLIRLTGSASLMRVVWGMQVLLDPRNAIVDPALNHIEHHPDVLAALAARNARPLDEWEEDMHSVLWWKFPIDEPPYCGHPNCDNWPGYHTHFTPLLVPAAPVTATPGVPA